MADQKVLKKPNDTGVENLRLFTRLVSNIVYNYSQSKDSGKKEISQELKRIATQCNIDLS